MDGDFAYIGRQLSRPLVQAVAEVADVRPADPITHIAESLRSYRRRHGNQMGDHTATGSDKRTGKKQQEKARRQVRMIIMLNRRCILSRNVIKMQWNRGLTYRKHLRISCFNKVVSLM